MKRRTESDLKSHWEDVYRNKSVHQLGWYEEDPEPSIRLIQKCELDKDAILLNVGAGATTLIDELLKLKYNNLIATDLSSIALKTLQNRLGAGMEKVRWIVDDLLRPLELNKLGEIDLWHDRAVLHFFNDDSEQRAYFNLLLKLVKKGGYVIIATFNLNTATKCSGLPVHRYDRKMLQEKLGNDFKLNEAFDYEYIMPSGERREYIYTLFRRAD